jgi:hypothetical protein
MCKYFAWVKSSNSADPRKSTDEPRRPRAQVPVSPTVSMADELHTFLEPLRIGLMVAEPDSILLSWTDFWAHSEPIWRAGFEAKAALQQYAAARDDALLDMVWDNYVYDWN